MSTAGAVGCAVWRAGIRVAAVLLAAGLAVTLLPGVAAARPRNPSDAEITAAQRDRAYAASEVGRLTGLVAQADGDMRRASDAAELAVEQYNKALVDLASATERARRAGAAAAAAERAVQAARAEVSRFTRGSYMQGSTLGSAGDLLEADGPADLMQRAVLLSYARGRQLDALGQLDRAKVGQANARSTAQAMLDRQQAATVRAAQAKEKAARAVATARAALIDLQTRRAALAAQLEAARVRLNGLLGERQRYQAWKRAQELAAARERQRLALLRAQAARRAAAAAAAARDQLRTGASRDDGASGGSASWSSRGAGWSPAKGQRVADAALTWLGTPYAWGGGSISGPTYGIDGPGAGRNDGSVVGFDCSGLAMWAWAQVGIYLPHYSGYQYLSGQHVALNRLRPGDLVFWAYDTSDPATIHHVAIYLGAGQVVQAPQSGDVVRVSALWLDGYLGATRPGT